jgi:hypothetical protein
MNDELVNGAAPDPERPTVRVEQRTVLPLWLLRLASPARKAGVAFGRAGLKTREHNRRLQVAHEDFALWRTETIATLADEIAIVRDRLARDPAPGLEMAAEADGRIVSAERDATNRALELRRLETDLHDQEGIVHGCIRRLRRRPWPALTLPHESIATDAGADNLRDPLFRDEPQTVALLLESAARAIRNSEPLRSSEVAALRNALSRVDDDLIQRLEEYDRLRRRPGHDRSLLDAWRDELQLLIERRQRADDGVS